MGSLMMLFQEEFENHLTICKFWVGFQKTVIL